MLRLILQVKPGSPLAHKATINLFGDPASLKMRLKIYLKCKSSQQDFFERLDSIIEKAISSQPNPHFSDISDMAFVSDDFGAEYPLWIPARGLNPTEINDGRDNPQQFL